MRPISTSRRTLRAIVPLLLLPPLLSGCGREVVRNPPPQVFAPEISQPELRKQQIEALRRQLADQEQRDASSNDEFEDGGTTGDGTMTLFDSN